MRALLHRFMADPWLYHTLRNTLLGGLPIRAWAALGGLNDPEARVCDLGCGPADVLRYLDRARQPQAYLGIDFDDEYLNRARVVAERLGLSARFLKIDLRRLSDDPDTQRQLIDALTEHRIDRVLLLGVMHHLSDEAVTATLDVLHRAPTVRAVVTQDVAILQNARVNNYLSRRDRGEFVRTPAAYDRLLAGTPWAGRRTDWTSPGLWLVRYVHFTLTRD